MRGNLLVWLALSTGLAGAACTQLLGNDFEVVEGSGGSGATGGSDGGNSGEGAGGTGAGGTGGTGGTGGSGTGGSGPATTFSCAWAFQEHMLLHEVSSGGVSFDDLVVLRRDNDSARVIIMERGSNPNSDVRIFTVDETGFAQSFMSRAATSIEHGLRLSPSQLALVGTTDAGVGATAFEPRLWVMSDSDDDASGINTHVIADSGQLLDRLSNQSIRVQGARVPQAGIDDWQLDFTVSYETRTAGHFAEFYGRYDPDDGLAFMQRITLPAGLGSEDATDPVGMVHLQGVTHAFHGEGALHAYALAPSVAFPIASRAIGTTTQGLGPIGTFDGTYANVSMYDTGVGIRLLTGRVEDAALETFTSSDLALAADYQTAADLPVVEGEWRWLRNVLAMLGPDGDESNTLGFLFLDNEGRQRGTGSLPFTANLPGGTTRQAISDTGVALRGSTFDSSGATLHVAWTERHLRSGNPSQALYYDQLECTPIDE